MTQTVPITAVFPAYNRVDASLRTIELIKACNPSPSEIIVHVDGGESVMAKAMADAHPDVKILVSLDFVGPGGARNILIKAATYDWVANFDDDSAPLSPDYFARACRIAELYPDAAVISAASLPEEKIMPGRMRIGIFSGCGCIYQKRWFLRTRGFVPLRIAYCMEEVDLSLQFHHLGGVIVHDPLLQVNHRKAPPDAVPIEVDAHVLANIALLPVLRYPAALLPLTLMHVLARMAQMARRGDWCAVLAGLVLLPVHLARHIRHRQPVSMDSLLAWRELCVNPVLLGFHEADEGLPPPL